MFELGLSEEERLIQQTARRFAAAELAPKLREHERARGIPEELRARFSGLGLATVDFPAAAGGQALGSFAKTLVLEELGFADAGSALALDPLGLAAYPLFGSGSEDGIAIARSFRGRAWVVEGDDARFAERDGRVSGVSAWVPADALDGIVVMLGGRALVVRDGIELENVQACGLEAAGASELRLDRAPVALALESSPTVRARMRLHVAALLVGVAAAASAYAIGYAKERTAFGRPIAHHQALAFLLVDMATAVDVARMAVWRAAAAIDRNEEQRFDATDALAEAAEQALFVAPAAVQILGGHGFMKDHPVEKYMRDVRTLAALAGGRDQTEVDAADRVYGRETSFA
jgi:alkylation response protein AidB-like acyl-CoA dehydrogenase